MTMRLTSALLTMALAFAGLALPAGAAVAAEPETTQLALAIPLTVPPETTGLISADNLQKYTSPTGILTRRLSAVIDRPVAIGLDPMIIASIRILGNTAPQSAQDWLSQLQGATNEIFALSYADSDLAALGQAGSPGILRPTSFAIDPSLFPIQPAQPGGAVSAGPTPVPGETPPPAEPQVPTSETITDWPYTIDSLLWPRENTVVAGNLAAFNAESSVTTILGSGNVTSAGSASGVVDGAPVLVSDDTISQLIRQAVHALTPAEWQTRMDQIALELATRPGSGTLLATFDRTPIDRFNRLPDTVAAIAQMSGVNLVSLSASLSEKPRKVGLTERPVDSDRVSRMRLLLASEALIGPFSTVLNDPAVLTGERRLSLMALTSNSWLEVSDWAARVTDWLDRTKKLLTSVQLAESSTLNFFQDTGNLPIAISNGLPYPITVYVTVRSTTGILVVTNSRVPLEMEANSQSRVSIPVQSIANGTASLEVSLSSASGVSIGTPKTVTTNVVAGWETTATWIIAALLVILFVAGIVRTVLKRRRVQAEEQAPSTSQESGE